MKLKTPEQQAQYEIGWKTYGLLTKVIHDAEQEVNRHGCDGLSFQQIAVNIWVDIVRNKLDTKAVFEAANQKYGWLFENGGYKFTGIKSRRPVVLQFETSVCKFDLKLSSQGVDSPKLTLLKDTNLGADAGLVPCKFCEGTGWTVSETTPDEEGISFKHTIQCLSCSGSGSKDWVSNTRGEIRSEDQWEPIVHEATLPTGYTPPKRTYRSEPEAVSNLSTDKNKARLAEIVANSEPAFIPKKSSKLSQIWAALNR